MSSNKKDICPVCGINEKGVQSKSCRPCALKKLTDPGLSPAEPKAKTESKSNTTTESKSKAKTESKSNTTTENRLKVKAELEAKLKAMPEPETGFPVEPDDHLLADHEWCQSIIDGLMKERDECLDQIEKIKAENASKSESESKPMHTVGQITPDGKYYV